MRTAYITHPSCWEHDTGPHHPEAIERLSAIENRLHESHVYDFLRYYEAPAAERDQLLRVHTPEHINEVESRIPSEGHAYVDPDTIVCPNSLTAALHSAGAGIMAVDLLMSGAMQNAFCNVRPPGHHAEANKPMGFCLFNNIAVAAAHAIEHHGLERVAIIDFDVHHGNGTEDIFLNNEQVMFCSTFQHPFYPNTELHPIGDRLVSIPLDAQAASQEFRDAVDQHWLPALRRFAPQMIFISAGFDAHREDDMSNVRLTDSDYGWVTEQLMQVAAEHAEDRVIACLEGGYDLPSLARSVTLMIKTLMNLH